MDVADAKIEPESVSMDTCILPIAYVCYIILRVGLKILHELCFYGLQLELLCKSLVE